MYSQLKFFIHLAKKAFLYWRQDGVARIAAAFSYYTIFALAPILVICIAVASFVLGKQEAQAQVLKAVAGHIDQSTLTQIQFMVEQTSQPSNNLLATFIGIGLLLLAAAGWFGELQTGLNTIWGVKAHPKTGIIRTIKKRLLSFLMVFAIALLVLLSLIITTSLAVLGKHFNNLFPYADFFWLPVNFFVSLFLLTCLFTLLFKILPDVRISWHDTWLAGLLTACLFTIGKIGLEFYIRSSNIASAYGVAGSIIIIMVWVYYTSQILFFGAEFSKVIAESRKKTVKPARGAVFIEEKSKTRGFK